MLLTWLELRQKELEKRKSKSRNVKKKLRCYLKCKQQHGLDERKRSLDLRERKRIEKVEKEKAEKTRESSIKRSEIEQKIKNAKLTTELYIKSQVDNFLKKEHRAQIKRQEFEVQHQRLKS